MLVLAERFEQHIQQSIQHIVSATGNTFVADTWKEILKALHQGDEVLFTPGTMRMLSEKLRDPQQLADTLLSSGYHLPEMSELLQRFTAGIIQFPQPITVPVPILGMFFSNPASYLTTGRNMVQVMLLDEHGHVTEYVLQIEDGVPSFDPRYHQCQDCKRSHGSILELCQDCQYIGNFWTQVFSMSCIITGQYLAARRYEEKQETVLRRVPREKNTNKKKTVPVKHIIKIIDANEIVIPVLSPQTEQTRSEPGEHSSWLAQALALDPSSVDYKEIRTRPFMRTYRSERFVNMKGQTQEFPEGIMRKQPRLREYEGKRITKVKASDYEE